MHLLQVATACSWRVAGEAQRGGQVQICEQHLHQEPFLGVPGHCCGAAAPPPGMGHAPSDGHRPAMGQSRGMHPAVGHSHSHGAQPQGTHLAMGHPRSRWAPSQIWIMHEPQDTRPAMGTHPPLGHTLAVGPTLPTQHRGGAGSRCASTARSRKDPLWGQDEAKPQKRGSPRVPQRSGTAARADAGTSHTTAPALPR